MKLNDYLKAINHTKENLLDTDDEFVERGYAPFVVNRCLSYFPDTLFMVNEMNACPTVDKKMHFDYLLNSIRKKKRFTRWLKAEKNEDVDAIKEYYSCNHMKACEIAKILTDEQLSLIHERLNRGGLKNGKRKR